MYAVIKLSRKLPLKFIYFLIGIETQLVSASSTGDISSRDFGTNNSVFIPAAFIQQRSSITGEYNDNISYPYDLRNYKLLF